MSVKERLREGVLWSDEVNEVMGIPEGFKRVSVARDDTQALLSLIEAVEKMEAIKAQGIDKFVELHEALNEVWAALKAVTE